MPSPGYYLTDSAQIDIDEIWDYIAQFDPSSADRVIEELASSFSTLGDFPEMGRSHAKIKPGLRGFVVSPYIVFYDLPGTGVRIVRVLHSARDWPRILVIE